MLSSGNQQNICQIFLNKNIETIRDFINEFCEFDEQILNHKWSRTNHYDFSPDLKIYVTKNENRDLILFNDLIEVLQILEQEKILFFKSNSNHGELFPFFRKNGHHEPIRPYDEIIDIIKKYYAKIFIIDKDKLNLFIQKKYKTKQELNDELQVRKNKRFQIAKTIIAALVAFVLGIISEKYIFNDDQGQGKQESSIIDTLKRSQNDTLQIITDDSMKNTNKKSTPHNKSK